VILRQNLEQESRVPRLINWEVRNWEAIGKVLAFRLHRRRQASTGGQATQQGELQCVPI
jgi:hypothetical protein